MKVLFLSKYGRLAASTRYRHEQFLPVLRENGIDAEISPLLGDDYLNQRFASGAKPMGRVASAFLRRFRAVLDAKNYDLVIIHCEIYPYLPALFERYLVARGIPYFYDFDDAIFHQYDLHRNPLVRAVLGRKIARVIKGATAVLAGNEYLANYARQTNANVHIVPTVVDVNKYEIEAHRPDDSPFTIGWIGSPSTARYVKEREKALRAYCERHKAQVVLIGSGPVDLPGVPLIVKDWREDSEIRELRAFDVGIMPLTDDPWARGKCGFKLIQYMAAKVPVVASPVGVNQDLVKPGREGFLATTDDEWVQALETIHRDAAKRREMGMRGYERVVRDYSLQAIGPKLAKIIRSVETRAPLLSPRQEHENRP